MSAEQRAHSLVHAYVEVAEPVLSIGTLSGVTKDLHDLAAARPEVRHQQLGVSVRDPGQVLPFEVDGIERGGSRLVELTQDVQLDDPKQRILRGETRVEPTDGNTSPRRDVGHRDVSQ